MKKALIIILAVAILGLLSLPSKKPAVSPAPASSFSTPAPTKPAPKAGGSALASYKDGDYTGSTAETPYGPVQVEAIVSGGKITDIKFLQMPSDMGHSREVTMFSEPYLKQMALAGQTAHIDFISGATSTSEGFEQSLQAALDQAAV